MKRIYNIFAVAMAAVSLVACDHVSKFNSVTFATFTENATSKTILENVESVNIPVAVYGNSGTCTVAFEVVDPNNAKGVAFNIEPANGVLTFNGNETKNIVIKPINRPDDISGNIPFSIKLSSVSGGSLGSSTEYKLAIADYVPVTWSFVTGTWHATDYDGTTYDVEIAKVDDTTLSLYNLWDADETITGTIVFNEAENTALITFASQQVMYNSGDYGPVGIFGLTETGGLDTTAAYATVDAGGITLGPWIAIILTGKYAGYSFDDGGLTTFSK